MTLSPEVAEMIKKEVHARQSTFKEVVNEAIRRGLSAPTHATDDKPFRVVPHRAHLRPGFDRRAFNQLADQLEDDAVMTRATGTSGPPLEFDEVQELDDVAGAAVESPEP